MPSRSKKLHSSKFGFHDECALVSYCTSKNKCVMILSTLHNDAAIEPDSGEKATPEIYSFYNQTKTGVDAVSSLCEKYDVSTNSNRWPTVLFYTLLNISAINALCIYKLNKRCPIKRRSRMHLGIDEPTAPTRDGTGSSIGRCYLCGRAPSKSTRRWCQSCQNWACKDHMVDAWSNCIENH